MTQARRTVIRGLPAAAHEGGAGHRCVVVEFETVADAVAAYESAAYREALAALDGSVKREVRILEGQ